MQLYPAIDLMSGQAVRLRQGRAEEKTVYSDDPVAVAREWEARGGDWLHVVDLDAAFRGEQSNLDMVRRIAAAISIPVQLGGGIRDEAAIARALEAGVSRVVIGTRAAAGDDFVARAVEQFGGAKIAVGIDAKAGLVAVRGWTEATQIDAADLAKRVGEVGVGAVIYTDIATDGMLQGPNLKEVAEIISCTKAGVIASGGVSSAADLCALDRMEGLAGAIIGKALFDGRITGPLRQAMAQARNGSGGSSVSP
jgi:phosphoribosylformimino-5-aminoimidazole carboxamide ribotide isomerase